jgi:spore coat protein U-like protein
MNFRALTLAGAFCALAIAPIAASATGSVQGGFGVDANVPTNCTVPYNGGFHFGSYDPLVANRSTPIQTYAGFGLECTLGTVPVIDQSYNGFMTNGSGGSLAFNLAYGNTSPAVGGINNVVSVNFLGTVPAGQDVPVGSYTGSATINVNF